MSSYRFARRAFLQGVGGAVGLKVLLRGFEAMAEGATSPPRLLIAFWPIGTVQPDFVPAAGADWTTAPILKPFGAAGLAGDTSVFFGLSTTGFKMNGSSGDKGGMVATLTGLDVAGTRAGEIQSDDAYAGGPSFDQIFLKNAPLLQRPGVGFANSICDTRVDFLEIGSRCMSYAYATRPVARAGLAGGTGTENIPQMATLSPFDQYASLFAGLVPGGPTVPNQDQVVRALRERKSVLDLSLRQLARLRTLAPAAEATKLDIHAAAIRDIETRLSDQIAHTGNGCSVPVPPPMNAVGKAEDNLPHNDYGNPRATMADDPVHGAVGTLHLGVLRAAFLCDLIRVATFQWSPGTNHVAFQNMYPGETDTIYMHNPLSHRINPSDTLVVGPNRRPEVGFLSNVQTWYNAQMAARLAEWKTSVDPYGGNLLDHTVIPFVTDTATTGGTLTNLPAFVFGGKALGMRNGSFWPLANRPMNDLWITIAQAFGLSVNAPPLSQEAFVLGQHHTGVIDGLWSPPA